jgi:predicted DNA-binding protein (MmcQ/YjbR family)
VKQPAALSANEQQPHVNPTIVARVRQLCMALPGTAEKEAWGDPSWRAHGRMYAILKFGRGTALWMAAPEGAQKSLIESNPSRFYKPSNHPLHDGWIGTYLDGRVAIDWDEVEFLLAQAHEAARAKASARRSES